MIELFLKVQKLTYIKVYPIVFYMEDAESGLDTTKEKLEEKYDEVYYFKLGGEHKNPLLFRDVGQTIRLGRKQLKIQATGQVPFEDEVHGFLAGKLLEKVQSKEEEDQ